MNLIVRAFPIIPGKEEELRAMAREVSTTRAAHASEFFSRYGVRRESWHVQHTPHGSWVIGVTQLDGRPVDEVASEYSQSEVDFDRWFKNQVFHLSGINPDEQPLGPPTECIFDTGGLPPG
jgi:hypothetical protein